MLYLTQLYGVDTTLYGPNSTWGQYLRVGGNGRLDGHAAIFTTDGNLHLDSKDGGRGLFLNSYSKNPTYINPLGGNVGIGTYTPSVKLEVRDDATGIPAKFHGLNPLTHSEIQIYSDSGRLVAGSVGSQFPDADYQDSNYVYSVGRSHFHIKSTGDLRFSTGGTVLGNVRMVVDPTGNVGIGTVYTSSARMTLVTNNDNPVLRLENSKKGAETKIRLRTSSSNGSGFLHSEISQYSDSVAGSEEGYIGFKIPYNDNPGEGYRLVVNHLGNVGIGTTTPTEKLEVVGNIKTTGSVGIGIAPVADAMLAVNGTIKATKIKVVNSIIAADITIEKSDDWADFVFASDYNLRSIEEVDSFIQNNGHLPDMPTASDVAVNGYSLAEVNSKLLQKIEELTLYTIELNKQVVETISYKQKIENLENKLMLLSQASN